MMALLTFAFCLAGFGALALATQRHQQTYFSGVCASRTRRYRQIGWTALVAALVVTVARQGWGLGLVHYSGQTSMAAGLVYLALIVAERRRASR
ncbi:hypothetical protein PCA31118_04740 [Pandoraea captiosa]|jgi:hypothetical protein|uniref:DUF3325 domain-containing protein n=1 Tax=Pandoraea captiosa TaxID=2508302 RepID=A0A5E5ALT2_9BURK|nr:DUF3325 domain-containing protein [Pandoraea captiosa]VVE74394.1 hypothetical protein PCA31118_04740 [Pandoraea captiosa]